jgi:hypothetical protein
MPNWCKNVVKINGDLDKVAEIAKIIAERDTNTKTGGPGFLAYCVPEPNHSNTPRKEWVDWRWNNWGTRAEIDYISVIESSDTHITFSFESVWSPPIEALTNLMEHAGIDTVTAYYYEWGNAFAGVFRDGERVSFELDELTEDDYENALFTELDKVFDLAYDSYRQKNES